jgi:sugar lactone lactonase YvrE
MNAAHPMALEDDLRPLPVPPSRLGESPFWHPQQQMLYWCDIDGRCLNRYDPHRQLHDSWAFDTEIACAAPMLDGGVLLALRDGLWRLDLASGERRRLAAAPYDPREQRFNDGKADALGRFWVGTVHERREPQGALYCYADGRLARQFGEVVTSNGLGWSPDGRTMYWSDTRAHTVYAFDVDAEDGTLSRRRVFAGFAPKTAGQPYDGRPDGGAVDAEGCYWVAMYEGGQLLRFSPSGERLLALPLPVQCPTMPCFGGADLKTLYITTAREGRPAEELARMPWSGCVLQLSVQVPGLPVHFVL